MGYANDGTLAVNLAAGHRHAFNFCLLTSATAASASTHHRSRTSPWTVVGSTTHEQSGLGLNAARGRQCPQCGARRRMLSRYLQLVAFGRSAIATASGNAATPVTVSTIVLLAVSTTDTELS